MATLGDPLMDLGGTLAYWVQADDDEFFQSLRRQPTHLPGMLTREEVVAYYCEQMGFTVTPEQWRFYEVYGLFRLGGDRPADLLPLLPRADHQRGLRRLRPGGALPRAALPAIIGA